jgi:ATP-dependent DNA helicase RecG
MFSNDELLNILDHLRRQASENEVFEFKEAKADFSFEELGQYFSALSNEANLRGEKYAWLALGIRDKDRAIVGTQYRASRPKLDSLKKGIADQTVDRITFIEIFEVMVEDKRVIMFQIPAAPHGIPVSFKGHYYAREGESLAPLSIEKIERIRAQSTQQDWSAVVIPEATIDDLDPLALAKARTNYAEKFPEKAEEIKSWDDLTFLNKAKLTKRGKITRAALILLGREEAEYFINPSEAKIRWVLKDLKNQEKDYETFSMPFLLSVEKVHQKIRNLKYRYMKDGTLFPEEVLKYEPFVIREALNNCIAHQDYEKCGRINVIEVEDEKIIFTNLGEFIPGSVEKVVMEDAPEETYRNPFLVTAMFNLKMVDTAGGGIKKMFNFQRSRYFPLPDYELTEKRVKVTITGKVLDMEFARVLAKNPDLTFEEIIMLDKVQKQHSLLESEVSHLKKLGLIEGRKPNYFISSKVSSRTTDVDLKTQYVKQKAFDDDHAQMNRIIDAAVARFYEKTKDEKEEFRSLLGSFKNLYAFLAQIIPFYDTDLERLYCYLRALQLKLPWRGYSSPIDLDGKVALKYYRLQLISEGKIPLVKETQGAVYGPDEVGTGGEGISKEKLSKIIDILNEHFKTNFTSTDELLFESFKEDAEGDRQVREAAAVNTMDNFKYVFNHRLDDFVVDRLDQNGAIGARILNDPAFRKVVSDYLAQQVYDSIRGKMGLAEAKEKAHV